MPYWISACVQISILSVAYYYLLNFFRGTRGVQVLIGLALLSVGLVTVIHLFNFEELNWLISRFSGYVAVAFVVIFQPEIRRVLAELGRPHLRGLAREGGATVESVVRAAATLSAKRIGALIAIERDTGTRPIQDTGVPLDAKVTPELLVSIFHSRGPLHDGGMIIRQSRIVAAGCVFPLPQEKPDLDKNLGTRHRAAIGMSEEFGAVVVVVSEETGSISAAYRGRFLRNLDEKELRRFLIELLLRHEKTVRSWEKVSRALDLALERIVPTDSGVKQDNNP
ncbi:MAG: diadenylate cyclase CdaA [Kiritimatiellia bacterium]